jgi:hypothetical protein
MRGGLALTPGSAIVYGQNCLAFGQIGFACNSGRIPYGCRFLDMVVSENELQQFIGWAVQILEKATHFVTQFHIWCLGEERIGTENTL